MKNSTQILKELATEINETLMFFVTTDFNIYGFITKGTQEAFKTQNVKIPLQLLDFCHNEQQLSEQGLQLQNNLGYCTGSENLYYHSMCKALNYTDGVRLLAKEGECYWLLDIVASVFKKLQGQEFNTIKLDVYRLGNGSTKAIFRIEDGNNKLIYQQIIDYTDFPLDSIKLFYTNNVLFLPSEN